MLAGFAPFLILEIALRIFWTPLPTAASDPFLDFGQFASLFELNGDVYRIPRERMRLFAPAEFPVIKGSNVQRIFCIGGSTTQGEPYKPPTAYPEWMRLNLQLIAPDHKWEVINCGGLSYASYRMLPILIEVLRYQPDLVVIDCGHNEFLEKRDLSGWRESPSRVWLAMRVLRRSRVVQLASSCYAYVSQSQSAEPKKTRLEREVDALLDDHGGLEKYHRDDLQVDAVVKSMHWNVEAMVDACKRQGVPILLLIPTSNVRDCPPFKVEASPSLNAMRRQEVESHWLAARHSGTQSDSVVSSIKDQNVNIVVDELKEVLALDPEHAAALYWLGKFELSMGEIESARHHLISARDKDVCPLRAVTALQDSLRGIADDHPIWSFDVDSMFQSVSEHGLVGDRCLIDHVHPRIEGHQMLGERLVALLIEKNWVQPKDIDWEQRRPAVYREHLKGLDEVYYHRGKQRLAGLLLWTQGRARKGPIVPESRL